VRLCEYLYLSNPTQQRKNNEAKAGGDPLVMLRVKEVLQHHVEIINDETDIGAAEAGL